MLVNHNLCRVLKLKIGLGLERKENDLQINKMWTCLKKDLHLLMLVGVCLQGITPNSFLQDGSLHVHWSSCSNCWGTTDNKTSLKPSPTWSKTEPWVESGAWILLGRFREWAKHQEVELSIPKTCCILWLFPWTRHKSTDVQIHQVKINPTDVPDSRIYRPLSHQKGVCTSIVPLKCAFLTHSLDRFSHVTARARALCIDLWLPCLKTSNECVQSKR